MHHLAERADVLQKALKERNIDSMLEDTRNDNKDADAGHPKRKCDDSRRMTNVKSLTIYRSFLTILS